MSLSNHQKHGYHPTPKWMRRDKSWVSAKKYWHELRKQAKWNGKPMSDYISSEVGKIESIHIHETGA